MELIHTEWIAAIDQIWNWRIFLDSTPWVALKLMRSPKSRSSRLYQAHLPEFKPDNLKKHIRFEWQSDSAGIESPRI